MKHLVCFCAHKSLCGPVTVRSSMGVPERLAENARYDEGTYRDSQGAGESQSEETSGETRSSNCIQGEELCLTM